MNGDTLDLTVVAIDYEEENCPHDEQEEWPVFHVYGRTGENKLKHVRVLDKRPYFYVPTAELEQYESSAEEWFDCVTGTEEYDPDDGERYESIKGKPLTRIYTELPRDVSSIRDEFSDHFEADILFPNRLMIDLGIHSGIRVPDHRGELEKAAGEEIECDVDEIEPIDFDEGDLRVHQMDIEVDDRNGFPEDGEEPIICLTSWDSYDDQYILWVYESPDSDQEYPEEFDYDPLKGDIDLEVRVFEKEEDMLGDYLDYIEETDPDLATGWNWEDFDAPYIMDRLDKLNPVSERILNSSRLSRTGTAYYKSGSWGGVTLKGRVVLDLLDAYKSTKFSEMESYRLEYVSQVELDAGKETYTGDIGDLWEDDPETLYQYSVRDVELTVELDKKESIISFWDTASNIAGCFIEEAPTANEIVDMYVLQKVNGDMVLPSKGTDDYEDYEGGAVFEPIEGVKEWVTVTDLKSLYPMCMSTLNLSPETYVPNPDEYEGDTYRSPPIPARGGERLHFQKEPDGIIRDIIDELLSERDKKKADRADHDPGTQEYEKFNRQQAAIKVIMNSCFTPDTEVMTPYRGVVNIRDLEVGDLVYSFNTNTDEVEIKPVVDTQAYPDYSGDIIDIETNAIDFSVTPDHRMLARQNDPYVQEDEWQFVEAQDLNDSTNYEMPHSWDFDNRGIMGDRIDLSEMLYDHGEIDHKVEDGKLAAPSGEATIERFVETEDFVKLLAWYVTEGSAGLNGRSNYRVHITQDESKEADEIEELLSRIAPNAQKKHRPDGRLHGFSFSSKPIMELLVEMCGSGSENKKLPPIVWSLSESRKELLLETLIAGDGRWKTDTSFRYTTQSDELRDHVMRLCVELGYNPRYKKDNGVWRVYVKTERKNSFRMNRSSEQRDSESGVYCVTVADNHSLMAGRNGKFQFVGNCYGVLGWERFRLYDKDMGAAVTAAGRGVIEHTEQIVNEMGYNVTYGDTDSVMISLAEDLQNVSVDVSDEVREAHPDMGEDELQKLQAALDRSFEMEQRMNESYDEFAADLNAQEHRFEMEFEKLYRRFFQAGKKKRYAGHKVWKEGNHVDSVGVTGFEYKRSDTPDYVAETQKELMDRIVRGNTDDLKAYAHDRLQTIKDGDVDLDAIGIPKGLGKKLDNYETVSVNVRAAMAANLLLGRNFGQDDKPRIVYVDRIRDSFWHGLERRRKEELERDDLYRDYKRRAAAPGNDDSDNKCAIAFNVSEEVPDEFEIDWDTQAEKAFEGPIKRVLAPMGITWDEVETGQTQTGLGQWG